MEVRHPRARLMNYLTVSLRAVRAELKRGGFEGFLEWSTPAALPTAPPVTGQNYLEVSWPSDRKSTRLNSSHSQISYAVFCLKKKNQRHPLFIFGFDSGFRL